MSHDETVRSAVVLYHGSGGKLSASDARKRALAILATAPTDVAMGAAELARIMLAADSVTPGRGNG